MADSTTVRVGAAAVETRRNRREDQIQDQVQETLTAPQAYVDRARDDARDGVARWQAAPAPGRAAADHCRAGRRSWHDGRVTPLLRLIIA